MVVYGLNAVLEALRAGRVRQLSIGERAPRRGSGDGTAWSPRVQEVVALAAARGVPWTSVDVRVIDRAAGGRPHQGVMATLAALKEWTPASLVSEGAEPALVVVLDEVEDPHNVGAILRSAEACGASGVVRQSRRSAALDGVVAKTSSGAVAHVRIATVVNVARAIEELKSAGVWTVGLAGDAEKTYDEIDFTLPTALVVGAEGTGLRRLVRERCDWLVSIPMRGQVSSLNVSVATGVVLFEAERQRRMARRAQN